MPKKIDIILINVITLVTCFIVLMVSTIAYMTIDIISVILSKVF